MINATLAIIYAGVNVFQFFVLPLWLLPKNIHWAWIVVPLALLTNPFWSLIHEAIHDLFHPKRAVNAFAGRALAIFFGSPFRILRMSHLVHHKLNRLPVEGTEYFDRQKTSKAAAAPGYFFQILLGLYLVELISPLFFFLPRGVLKRFKERCLRPESVSALLMQNWLGDDALREIRRDGLADDRLVGAVVLRLRRELAGALGDTRRTRLFDFVFGQCLSLRNPGRRYLLRQKSSPRRALIQTFVEF